MPEDKTISETSGRPPGGTSAGDSAAAKPKEPPIIHVIPDEFYGMALKRQARVSQPVQGGAVSAVAGASPSVSPPNGDRKSRKANLALLAVLAVLILTLAGLAAYYFLFMGRQAEVPAREPAAEVPSVRVPVCGDGFCGESETHLTCPADCPAPVPACGDGSCDDSETHLTCPADCPAPVPACGDGICEEAIGESHLTCPADCPAPQPSPSPDTDSDGVTDIEETEIYGTNPYSPDSDGDSFVDLNEILNLFNPAAPQPSVLLDNPGIRSYTSQAGGFSVYHPSVWTVTEDGAGGVVFRAGTGETISVSVRSGNGGETMIGWYLSLYPSVGESAVQSFQTRQGHTEAVSPDQMSSYLDVGGRLFEVSYDLGNQLRIRYKATFKMMVNSLDLLP